VTSHRTDVRSHAFRWDLGSRGVRALAALAVLVALVAGFIAWRARPAVEPLAPGPLPTAPVSASAPTVVVAISGRVRRPGLVRLVAGSRVADAIDAAGGVLPDTDLSGVNLARKVADGELIVIGIPPPSGAGPATGPGGGGGPVGLVNLNTATLEQLQTLPGVGPVLAQRIVEYREQNGGFGSVADLRKVSGIGDARYNELKARVTV
jgi:competence protein ComEA